MGVQVMLHCSFHVALLCMASVFKLTSWPKMAAGAPAISPNSGQQIRGRDEEGEIVCLYAGSFYVSPGLAPGAQVKHCFWVCL